MTRKIRRLLAALRRHVERYSTESDAIAKQVTLLALNAQIEAIRVGAAAGAFAVVAQEIKSLAGRTREQAEDFNRAVLDELSTATSLTDELLSRFEEVQMLGIARALCENVTRYLFERSIDLRMLSQDDAVVAAVADPSAANLSRGLARLERLLSVCPYYLNAFVADRTGRVILSADPRSHVIAINLSTAEQFRQLMDGRSPDAWCAGEVWKNPDAGGTIMLVYAAAVHAGNGAHPDAVLYLEFDWAGQIGEILAVHRGFAEVDGATCTLSIVDGRDRLVASTADAGFGDAVDMQALRHGGIVRDASSVTVATGSEGGRGADGLDLRYMVQQRYTD